MISESKKILIIEDEPSLLDVLEDKFSTEGFDVLKAENGNRGLEIALKEHPDLILLDIILPEMDGMTMLKKLREDVWGKDALVIILTNLNDAQSVLQSLENGVYDFLVKTDWKLEDVLKKVKEKLRIE